MVIKNFALFVRLDIHGLLESGFLLCTDSAIFRVEGSDHQDENARDQREVEIYGVTEVVRSDPLSCVAGGVAGAVGGAGERGVGV